MKQLFVIITLILSNIGLNAQMNLILDYAHFYLPESGPYVEVYLSVNGNSLRYSSVDSTKLQAALEVTYLIDEGDTIKAYEKFRLNSPEYGPEDQVLDMRDLKRLAVPNGNYNFTLIAKDLNSGQVVETSQELRPINYKKDKLTFSEIQLANSLVVTEGSGPFVKNGLLFDPNFTHYFGDNNNSIYFYTELYYSNKVKTDSVFLLEYAIVDAETEKVAANLSGFKRVSAAQIVPIVQSFKIDDLPSGKFALRVQLKNRKNKVLATKKSEFYRSNPNLVNFSAVDAQNSFVDSMTNKDVLAEYIRSLSPISTATEREFAKNQLKYADLTFMQQYFLNFWKSRNPANPETEWLLYKKEVEIVDELFHYGKTPGYKTERGRVYLQYGKPNSMQNVPYEANTFPYSVWHYNKINGLSNRKFLFYSPSMEILGYEVLHSNVPGEVKNPNWEMQLMSKSNSGVRPTQETPEGTLINQRAKDLWDNPR